MNQNFWCADPAAAAAALRAQYPRAAERACAIADDVCANRFLFRDHWEMERTNVPVQFGPEEKDIDWALIPAGDPEWIYAMNRHTSFVNLAKAWLLTGDGRYAQGYARLIEDWIDRVPLTGESRNDTWRSLEAGLRCENWLRALELLAGSGVPGAALRQKIETCLRQHGDYLAEASNDFHRLSNWGVLQDHGLFLLGVYFDRADWRQLALDRLDENLHHAVFGDGSQWEQSPMYHCEALHNALDVVLVGRKAGVPLPAPFTDAVHRMCRALAAWVKPDGRLPMQSDSDDMDARDLLAAGALLFEDGALRALAGDALLPENLWDFGPEAAARYAALPAGPAARGSAALPDSGNYMLRGAQGAWAHMHCGCLGSGHGHADLLHLDAGVAGEDVLIDSGRYTYVDSAIRRRLKLPAAHNTTRVDGEDFSACVDSWGYSRLAVPLKGEHRFTPQADYISGLHLGYLDRGAVVGRKVVFLKEQGLAVIFDQLYAAGEHLFEQRFHFAPGTLAPAGDGACWQGRRAAARLLCLGDGLEQAWSREPFSREYNRLEEGAVLTCRRRTGGFNWFVTVLSLDGDGRPHPLTAELLPVTRLRRGDTLPDAMAQAVRIVKDGRQTVVVACHGEAISEVDLLAAGGCEGYGKLLVFTGGCKRGLCLAW